MVKSLKAMMPDWRRRRRESFWGVLVPERRVRGVREDSTVRDWIRRRELIPMEVFPEPESPMRNSQVGSPGENCARAAERRMRSASRSGEWKWEVRWVVRD